MGKVEDEMAKLDDETRRTREQCRILEEELRVLRETSQEQSIAARKRAKEVRERDDALTIQLRELRKKLKNDQSGV